MSTRCLDIPGLQQNIARDEDEFRAGFVRSGLLALSLFFDLIFGTGVDVWDWFRMTRSSEADVMTDGPPEAEAMLQIETAHRLGEQAGRQWRYTSHGLKAALRASSEGCVQWHQSEERMSCPKIGRVSERPSIRKGAQALVEAQAAGLDFDLLIDMQDARDTDIAMRKTVAPVLCFNRPPGAVGRVLWPMQHVHGVGSPAFSGQFGGADLVPFAQRKDRFVWRGNINGSTRPMAPSGLTTAVTDPAASSRVVSARFLLDRRRDPAQAAALWDKLRLVPRFGFIDGFQHHPLADIGLTTQHENPALQSCLRPRLSQAEMAANRYIVVLPGADLATSFFWSMASGSLCLVMAHEWQSFASCHFKPWEHYLPFAQDCSDFAARLDWARANPDACAAMAARAQAVMRVLDRAEYRQRANTRLVDALRERMAKG